jgi:hypothetical protein
MTPNDDGNRILHRLRGLPELAPGVLQDRRARPDRRRRILWSIIYGGFRPRRRAPRRREGERYSWSLDWHASHLLVVAIGILLLSVTDAALTLLLLERGALEVNPVMDLVVHGDSAMFAELKMTLTGVSVLILVGLARQRFLRRFRVESALYAVLLTYLTLIAYELWMLRTLDELPFGIS